MKTPTQQLIGNLQELAHEYPNYSEDQKKQYWNRIFHNTLRNNDGKIKISEFRNHPVTQELDIEKYAQAWVEAYNNDFSENDKTYTIDDLFELDDLARKNLWLAENSKVKEDTHNILNHIISIGDQQISIGNLSEQIWDLYYDTLAAFFDSLRANIRNTVIQLRLQIAKWHIDQAWEICQPHMNWDVNPKHQREIATLDPTKLWEEISILDESVLLNILSVLWSKLESDAQSDRERWRKKLSQNLFSAAKQLNK